MVIYQFAIRQKITDKLRSRPVIWYKWNLGSRTTGHEPDDNLFFSFFLTYWMLIPECWFPISIFQYSWNHKRSISFTLHFHLLLKLEQTNQFSMLIVLLLAIAVVVYHYGINRILGNSVIVTEFSMLDWQALIKTIPGLPPGPPPLPLIGNMLSFRWDLDNVSVAITASC